MLISIPFSLPVFVPHIPFPAQIPRQHNSEPDNHALAPLFQISPGIPLQRLPNGIYCSGLVKECLHIPVQGAHFFDGIHGVVAGTELSQTSGAHKPEKAQTVFSISSAFIICTTGRENFVSRPLDCPAALDISVQNPV